MIEQCLDYTYQSYNREQKTLAVFLQTYYNSKIDTKKSKPIEDDVSLLPFSEVWRKLDTSSKAFCSKDTAIDIVDNYEQLDGIHKNLLKKYIEEVRDISRRK